MRNDQLAPDVRRRTLASLAECVASESRLLDQLAEILREQREGVETDDVQRVDDSVRHAHRVMQTLGEARRQRKALVHLLTNREDVPISALADALGSAMTPELGERRTALEFKARSVSREVALNRAILSQAIESGNDYVRLLVSPAPAATYGGRGESVGDAHQPILINQRV